MVRIKTPENEIGQKSRPKKIKSNKHQTNEKIKK
jgi:hypothetical protein